MSGFIVSALVGVLCIVIGIVNMKGNISSLHEYHRHRVSEEDRLPFGKMVGLGTVIIGIGVILFSGFGFLTLHTGQEFYTIIGTAIMILSMVIGLALSFYAMKKYNKGIF